MLGLLSAVKRRLVDWKHLGLAVALMRSGHGRRTLQTRVGKITIRREDSDLETFRQVFITREYDLSRFPQNARVLARYEAILAEGHIPLIIDAGANVGAASMWFAQQFQKARIVAVEPEPTNAALARENTRAYPNVEVVESGIAATPGAVTLRPGEEGLAFAVQTERSETGVPLATVESITRSCDPLARLLIVKVDIEGFEDDLFSQAMEWLDDVAAVFVEPHDWMLPDRKTSRGFQQAFAARDFDILLIGENLAYVR